MMKKIMVIIESLLNIFRQFVGRKTKQASTEDENIKNIKAGLDAAPQTKKVEDAKKKIEYIETLSEKEREKKYEDIAEVQKIVEEEVKAKPIDEDRAKSIIEKYKKKREQ